MRGIPNITVTFSSKEKNTSIAIKEWHDTTRRCVDVEMSDGLADVPRIPNVEFTIGRLGKSNSEGFVVQPGYA
jgi:hypothetical protein